MQHAFPHDFRSGPSKFDWDPSKWIILALHNLGLTYGLKRAREKDIHTALKWMSSKHSHHHLHADPQSSSASELSSGTSDEGEEESDDNLGQRLMNALPVWSERELEEYVGEGEMCVIVINGRVVDVTGYLDEHVSQFNPS